MRASGPVRRLAGPLAVCLLALTIHFFGLYVAPLRTELRDVEKQIHLKKRQIAYLEAEFSARASTERLNQYNELLYGYSAPGPDQYLSGENALAQLGGDNSYGPPVMISVAEGPYGIDPAGEIGSVVPQLSDAAPDVPQLTLPIEIDEGDAARTAKVSTVSDALAEKREQKELKRTERLATLDRQLLSDETLRTISAEANKEQRD